MIDSDTLDWTKMDGLLPAVVQDAATGEVRMLGYMDRAALDATIRDGLVTFHSRSRGGAWRKGETSGHVLELAGISADCDGDALLIRATPRGPTCHRGTSSCFGDRPVAGFDVLAALERTVAARSHAPVEDSYTAQLLGQGLQRIAQKVGEEGVEIALAAVAGSDAELTGEAADLIYHLTVLLHARGVGWSGVLTELERRHQG